MTKIESSKLMAMIVAAYPRGPWPVETVELYEREIQELDRDCAGEAVRLAIRTCKFQPTIAELFELHAAALKTRQRNVRLLEEARDWEAGQEVYRGGKWQRKAPELPERSATAEERAEMAWKIAAIGKGDAK